MRGLADTSIFIAQERARPLGELPAELAVYDCREAGARPRVRDALIAAIAVQHGLPVVTQDDDFSTIAAAHPQLEVIRV
jgi:predicted nucleic acid-binding protein